MQSGVLLFTRLRFSLWYLSGVFSLITLHGRLRVSAKSGLDLITFLGYISLLYASAVPRANIQHFHQLSLDVELPYVVSPAQLRLPDKQHTFAIRHDQSWCLFVRSR